MKKIIGIFLFTANVMFVFAQSWTNEITSLTVGSNQAISSATDRNGIHILHHANGTLKYGRINSAGTTIISGITVATGIGGHAAISLYDNTIYAVYEKNTDVFISKSTDGGSNWSAPIGEYSRPNQFGSLSSTADFRGVHVVWSEYGVSEAYYLLANVEGLYKGWYHFKEVSDYSNHTGKNPSVAVSANEVHVTYLPVGSGYAKSRDFLISQSSPTWEDPVTLQSGSQSAVETKTVVVGSTVHTVVLEYASFYGGGSYNVKHYIRPVNSTSFTYSVLPDQYYPNSQIVNVLTTTNGDIHLFYKKLSYDQTHMKYSGASWITITDNLYHLDPYHVSSAGNDLFLVAMSQVLDGRLTLRQYDAAPTAVQNPTVSVATVGGENYPRAAWSFNPEPDVYGATAAYEVWRRDDNYGSGSWTNWALKATRNGATNSYTDMEIIGAGIGPKRHEYKVRAKDLASNIGNYSSVVMIESGSGMQKIGSEIASVTPEKYGIYQNYPNPFNPTTTIRYQVPEDTKVSVVVYNVLGNEIATLVNGIKPAGYYETHFDASQLTSGVYFYRITAGSYSESRRMMLIK